MWLFGFELREPRPGSLLYQKKKYVTEQRNTQDKRIQGSGRMGQHFHACLWHTCHSRVDMDSIRVAWDIENNDGVMIIDETTSEKLVS